MTTLGTYEDYIKRNYAVDSLFTWEILVKSLSAYIELHIKPITKNEFDKRLDEVENLADNAYNMAQDALDHISNLRISH